MFFPSCQFSFPFFLFLEETKDRLQQIAEDRQWQKENLAGQVKPLPGPFSIFPFHRVKTVHRPRLVSELVEVQSLA